MPSFSETFMMGRVSGKKFFILLWKNMIIKVKETEIKLYSKCYPARALRALGLLLADNALTVGRGKTF